MISQVNNLCTNIQVCHPKILFELELRKEERKKRSQIKNEKNLDSKN
jgi:hypothetical protein